MKTLLTIIGFLFMGLLYGQGEKTGAGMHYYWRVTNTSPTLSHVRVNAISKPLPHIIRYSLADGYVEYNKNIGQWTAYSTYRDNDLDEFWGNCHSINIHKSLGTSSMWLATNSGLYYHEWREDTLIGQAVYDISKFDNETIWAVTDIGLFECIGGSMGSPTYTYTHYTTNDGLPTDSLTCITKDINNTQWIGSKKGLIHWTPNNVTVLDTSNSNLASNDIQKIDIDQSNNIWVATDAGVSQWNGSSWINYDQNDGLLSLDINAIYAVNDSIWVCTDIGLNLWDGQTWQSFQNFPSNNITCIFRDGNTYWLGTEDKGAIAWNDDGTIQHIYDPALVSNNIYDVVYDGLGNLVIGTDRGLNIKKHYNVDIYSPSMNELHLSSDWSTITAQDGLASDSIQNICTSSDTSIWISTHNGISHLQANGSIINYDTNNSPLVSNDVVEIINGLNDTIWIATTNGLMSFDGNNWIHYDTTNTLLNSNMIKKMAFHPPTASLWVVTDSLDLYSYRDAVWRHWTTLDGLPTDTILSVEYLEQHQEIVIGCSQNAIVWSDSFYTPYFFADLNMSDVTLIGSHGWAGYIFADTMGNVVPVSGGSSTYWFGPYIDFCTLEYRIRAITQRGYLGPYSDMTCIATPEGLFIHAMTYNTTLTPSPTLIPLHLYPNPSTHSIHIEGIEKEGYLHIYNIQGQLLYEEQVLPTTTHTVDIQHLPQGVYMLHYRNDEGIGTQQFIKQSY